jgi:putative nucleotidyltransferase with HDIG domain
MTVPLSVAEVISKLRELPSLSAVIMELLQSMGQEDVDTRMLADKISHDQALTAKTLRLANSSFYGMQRKVTTIQQAISILGFQSVRTLVTTAAVTSSFPAKSGAFDFQAFWRHSLATATCAKVLARHLHINQEYAFMAGLLHDIGRLVLMTSFPEHYQETMVLRATRDCYLFEAEHDALHIDHAMVGAALAEHWKFPESMQQAVANHHGTKGQESGSLTAIVHVADVIVHALDLSGDEETMVPPFSLVFWNNLRMDETVIMRVLQETDTQFTAACQILVA